MFKKTLSLVLGLIVTSTLVAGAFEPTAYAANQQLISPAPAQMEINPSKIQVNEPYITGTLSTPVISHFTDKNMETKVNLLLQNITDNFLNTQRAQSKLAYQTDQQHFTPRTVSLDYQVSYVTYNLISLVINKKSDDYPIVESYNIDLHSGKIIPFNRLFNPNENYRQITVDYITKNYLKGSVNSYLSTSDIQSEQNYYLKNNSVVLYFEPWEFDLDGESLLEYTIPFSAFKYGVSTNITMPADAVAITKHHDAKDTDWLQANINYPIISGLKDKTIETKINQLFQTDATKFLTDMDKQAQADYADYADYVKTTPDGYVWRPYTADLTYEVKKNQGNILSLYSVYYTYNGGAHGFHTDEGYNIDLNTGKLLQLSDLFKTGYDFKTVLNQKIKDQIALKEDTMKKRDQLQGHPDGYYDLYPDFKGISDNQSFYLTDDSLVIYFGLYEIGPYVVGVPTFPIPLNELSSGLK